MSEWPHLSKAPIAEALIDIRVELPDETDIERLSKFRDESRQSYPTCRERRKWQGQLQFSDREPPTVMAGSDAPDGYILTSADGTQVVQARLDGFTFSRLKPYQDWAHLRDSARDLWELYQQVACPSAITRIALRYINRLELPLPIKGLREWVLTVPDVPHEFPKGLAGFFTRLNIPFEKPRGFVNLVQAIEPGEYDETVPLILDIDVFSQERFEPSSEELWNRFEDLREIKNKVFFASITKKTKEAYQ